MEVTVHVTVEFNGAGFRVAAKLPREVARQIIRPIRVTDEPRLAGPLGVGDEFGTCVRESLGYELRKKAVDALAAEMAGHIMKEVGKADAINGWAVEREKPRDGI